jgi:hypothetical protein
MEATAVHSAAKQCRDEVRPPQTAAPLSTEPTWPFHQFRAILETLQTPQPCKCDHHELLLKHSPAVAQCLHLSQLHGPTARQHHVCSAVSCSSAHALPTMQRLLFPQCNTLSLLPAALKAVGAQMDMPCMTASVRRSQQQAHHRPCLSVPLCWPLTATTVHVCVLWHTVYMQCDFPTLLTHPCMYSR